MQKKQKRTSLPTAFMLITVWEGADDEEARWGDCTLVDVRELEDAPILTQLVDAAAKGSNGMWRVQVDLTGRFPEQEDSRFRLGGRTAISDDDVDNEINEIYITVKHLSQPCRIVGQLVVRNEM
jgi:hypothetical protein